VLSYGLPIVALTLLFSAAGIPTGVPIHVVLMLTGAYLIGSLPGLAVAIVALAAAELAGTLALHLISRTGGVRLMQRMASDRQDRMQTTFNRWRGRLGGRDVAAITVLRLIPFVRMGTTVGTGLLGIRLRDFVIGAGISAVIWTAIPLSIGYAFRSNVTTIEGYYHSILDALPMTLGIASLIVVAGVLGRSAATRARLREMVAPVWSRNHPPAVSIPEISQEPPPALN
jgi:membrane protein DedA with SNARE-associated domain